MKKALLISAMGLAAVLGSAFAQELGHVISSTPVVQDGRTVGYDVRYEYAGRQYSARMPYDPGQTIQLQVSPMASGQPLNAQAPNGPDAQPPAPAAQEPQARILREVPPASYPSYGYGYPSNGYGYGYGYPAYPVYYGYPYAYPYSYYPGFWWPPVSLSLGFGYVSHGHGGHGGHGHGHR